MAELGVIASIIGVAAVGARLSKTLFNVGSRTANASSNIHRISSSITLFCSSLKHVARVLDDSRSLHTAEAVETAKTIVDQCGYLFAEIGQIVSQTSDKGDFGPVDGITANDKRRRPSMVKRVKWYFEQPKVDYMIAQLEQLKTTLSMLIQTLSLGALVAAARREESSSERLSQQITDQRTHVETLLIAQQLSFVVLNQFNQTDQNGNKDGSRPVSPGTTDTEEYVDIPPNAVPKQLTQEPASLSLVKYQAGALDFMNEPGLDEEGTMSPIMKRSRDYVDHLLNRWTRIQEIPTPREQPPAQHDVDLEDQSLTAPLQRQNTREEIEIEEIDDEEASDRNVPDLKLEKVESLPMAERAVSSLPPPPPPSDQMLSIRRPPSRNATVPLSPTRSASPGLPPPPQYPGSPRPNTRLAVTRSGSTPGPDQMNNIPSSPYTPALSIRGLPPSGPPNSLATGQSNSWTHQNSYGFDTSNNMQTQSPTALSASPVAPTRLDYYNTPQTNYRKPFVSTRYSSDESDSDSEEDRRRHPSLGLGIPWRIRIGAKYWDFLDSRLVGPRTPYLPQDQMSWVYSHDNAITEISQRWVAEEALAEGKYPYSEVKPSEHPNMAAGTKSGNITWTGAGRAEEDIKWRVLRPLKFDEIESLVERTIDLYRIKTRPGSSDSTTSAANRPRAAAPPVIQQQQQQQQQPYLRVAPTSQAQHQQQAQPAPPPLPYHPKRSVSFSDNPGPPRGPRERSPRSPNEAYYAADHPHRPPLPFQGHWSAGPAPGAPSGWNQPQGAAQPGPAGRGWGNDGPPTPSGSGPGWSRDGGRQRGGYDFDRNFDRDHDDNRPMSRGKASNGGSSKGRTKHKKNVATSTAGTLARLGGVIALLDGLEHVV